MIFLQISLRLLGVFIIFATIFISTSNGQAFLNDQLGIPLENSDIRVAFAIDDTLEGSENPGPAEDNNNPIWGVFDLRSFIFVLSLMLGVILLSVEVVQYSFFFKNIFKRSPTRISKQVNDLVRRLKSMSDDYYRGGAMALSEGVDLKKMPPVWPLLIRQLELKLPFSDIVEVLGNEAGLTRKAYDNSIRMLSTFANLAPSLGVIGTVLGLVRLLYNLKDPTSLGPSMALALLTTLYGLMLSVVVFKPLMIRFESIREAQMNAYQYAIFWMGMLESRMPSFYTDQNFIDNKLGNKKQKN